MEMKHTFDGLIRKCDTAELSETEERSIETFQTEMQGEKHICYFYIYRTSEICEKISKGVYVHNYNAGRRRENKAKIIFEEIRAKIFHNYNRY